MVPWGPRPGQEELYTPLSILELHIRYDSKEWYDESLKTGKKKKTIINWSKRKVTYRFHGQ